MGLGRAEGPAALPPCRACAFPGQVDHGGMVLVLVAPVPGWWGADALDVFAGRLALTFAASGTFTFTYARGRVPDGGPGAPGPTSL